MSSSDSSPRAPVPNRRARFRNRKTQGITLGTVLLVIFVGARIARRIDRNEREEERAQSMAELQDLQDRIRALPPPPRRFEDARPPRVAAEAWDGTASLDDLTRAFQWLFTHADSGFGAEELTAALERAKSLKKGESAEIGHDVRVGGETSRVELTLFSHGDGRFDVEARGPDGLVSAFSGDTRR